MSTRPDAAGLATLMSAVYRDAGVRQTGAPEGFEVVTRQGDAADYVLAVNHRDDAVRIAATGTELLTGVAVEGEFEVAAGAVAVVRVSRQAAWEVIGAPH